MMKEKWDGCKEEGDKERHGSHGNNVRLDDRQSREQKRAAFISPRAQ